MKRRKQQNNTHQHKYWGSHHHWELPGIYEKYEWFWRGEEMIVFGTSFRNWADNLRQVFLEFWFPTFFSVHHIKLESQHFHCREIPVLNDDSSLQQTSLAQITRLEWKTPATLPLLGCIILFSGSTVTVRIQLLIFLLYTIPKCKSPLPHILIQSIWKEKVGREAIICKPTRVERQKAPGVNVSHCRAYATVVFNWLTQKSRDQNPLPWQNHLGNNISSILAALSGFIWFRGI